MQTCVDTKRTAGAKKLFKPIDREIMRVNLEQDKLKEAYNIIDENLEVTDLDFANKLFLYKNDLMDNQREEVRRLKDDYNEYMGDLSRPAAKLELKLRAPKHLVRQTKFIKI